MIFKSRALLVLSCLATLAFQIDATASESAAPAPNSRELKPVDRESIPRAEYTSEWNESYLRFGKTSGSFSDKTKSSNFGGAGHRRFADNFLYGVEYSYHYAEPGIRSNDIGLVLGWRPEVKHRVIPYANIFLGYGYAVNQAKNQSLGSGTALGAEVGAEVLTAGDVVVSVGSKITTISSSASDQPSRFDDFFVCLGFKLY